LGDGEEREHFHPFWKAGTTSQQAHVIRTYVNHLSICFIECKIK